MLTQRIYKNIALSLGLLIIPCVILYFEIATKGSEFFILATNIAMSLSVFLFFTSIFISVMSSKQLSPNRIWVNIYFLDILFSCFILRSIIMLFI